MSSKLTTSTENTWVTLSSLVRENAFYFLRALPQPHNCICLSPTHQDLQLVTMLSLAALSGKALLDTQSALLSLRFH